MFSYIYFMLKTLLSITLLLGLAAQPPQKAFAQTKPAPQSPTNPKLLTIREMVDLLNLNTEAQKVAQMKEWGFMTPDRKPRDDKDSSLVFFHANDDDLGESLLAFVVVNRDYSPPIPKRCVVHLSRMSSLYVAWLRQMQAEIVALGMKKVSSVEEENATVTTYHFNLSTTDNPNGKPYQLVERFSKLKWGGRWYKLTAR